MRDVRARGQNAVDALTERRAPGEPAVQHVAFLVVEVIGRRAAAEFVAERKIADRASAQGLTQRSRAEMRDIAGPGHGAHVGDGVDAVLLEQGQEIVEGQVRMADREQARGSARHDLVPRCAQASREAAAIASSQCRRYSG